MQKLLIILGIVFFISCQSGNKNQAADDTVPSALVLMEDTLNIGGMHCDMCVTSIEKGINELEGIQFVQANLNDSVAIVKFDKSKTNLTEIEKAIEKRGYRVKTQ